MTTNIAQMRAEIAAHILRAAADRLDRMRRQHLTATSAGDPEWRRQVQQLVTALHGIEGMMLRLDKATPSLCWHGLVVTCTSGVPQILVSWSHSARLRADEMEEAA